MQGESLEPALCHRRQKAIWKVRKKLPIGIDGFEKIRTNDFYYADKTLFIKKLIQNWGEVNLFTRPRRFGKSLNMSMLKCFFEIGRDPALFEGLKIMQEKELCERYMGKFPVISISLKSVDGLKYDSAVAALRTVIGNEAGRFRFLRDSAKLDVDDLLEFYGLSAYKDVIRDWYDGYRFGDTDVYCHWDVINYCDELLAAPSAPPKNYWANTSGNDLVRRMLKNASLTTKNEVEELLNGEKITKRIKQELTYCEIDDSIENVWSVLYVTGYLTGMYVEQADADIFHLWIPNGEIRKLFYELVEDWFRESTRSDTTRISRFCAAFPAGDTDTIQEMLSDYLWDSISVKDTAVRRNMKENFYHGMMLGLLQNQDSWLVKSNAETGEGYSDISIQTPERTGIVIELKYAEDGNMEKACSEALKQIEEKKYAEGLKRRGMKKIIKYGIAFYEKACMVVKE